MKDDTIHLFASTFFSLLRLQNIYICNKLIQGKVQYMHMSFLDHFLHNTDQSTIYLMHIKMLDHSVHSTGQRKVNII